MVTLHIGSILGRFHHRVVRCLTVVFGSTPHPPPLPPVEGNEGHSPIGGGGLYFVMVEHGGTLYCNTDNPGHMHGGGA